MRSAVYAMSAFVVWSLVHMSAVAQEQQNSAQTIYHPWSHSTIDTFAHLPVQDGGRVKPLSTYARFKLLQLRGRTSFVDLNGEQRGSMEWLLDTLFYPERSRQYKVFLVESPEVMDALSLSYEKPRDRYSYHQLAPARERLAALAQEYGMKEEEKRTLTERQVLRLAHNVFEFELLAAFLDFARFNYHVPEHPLLQAKFESQAHVRFSQIVERGPAIMAQAVQLRKAASAEPSGEEQLRVIAQMLQTVDERTQMCTALALFAPFGEHAEEVEWWTPRDLLSMAFQHTHGSSDHAVVIAHLERLMDSLDKPNVFDTELAALSSALVQNARVRGEYAMVPTEVTYYRGKFLGISLFLYIVAFLVSAICWLRPKSRILGWIGIAALSAPFLFHVTGIAFRCVIRGRPPVTTLYETLLFVTAVVVLVALCMEIMNRRRIALSLGAFLGTLGLFLALKYESVERTDTMPNLIAVLDTNFWLSTHVTTVTIGYAAGMLAGAIGHVYILGKAFGLMQGQPQFYKNVTRMTYGVICFGLLFATLGTVLGGIWANESWGRFWGWDPKENGALMIVLWGLFILHSRMGGYIRDFGINMCAVILAIIVGFSWFGVNLLGVGLHSYGFTSGIQRSLTIFYLVEAVILFLGAATWIRDRRTSNTAAKEALNLVRVRKVDA